MIKKIINEQFNNIKINDNLTIAIGNFDGFHLGHAKIIDKLLEYKNDTSLAVLFFDPHPNSFFNNEYKVLSTSNDKISFFSKYDLDYLIITKFNLKFSSMKASFFISFLKSINVKRIICGEDFRYGHKGEGTTKDLSDNFIVEIVSYYNEDNKKVSSSMIKDLVNKSSLDLAKKLLNRPYFIGGIIVNGQKNGRTIGYRTANLDYQNYCLPQNGVYYTKTLYNNILYDSITNIGSNPTVSNNQNTIKVETHILDFDKEIYDEYIKVYFLQKIREETKFDSLDKLKEQLNKDKKTVLALKKEYKQWI
ncbi:MAG: bifunctional riboflavin kinase/FAD synthetase [Acholeplasmatales bacterium]|jgi:riboflavin kinase/FMN adenylyltransferase|nr:bifunctional riboflavin kinase/FAD synthetase [Acholeplasmatales bacterium]